MEHVALSLDGRYLRLAGGPTRRLARLELGQASVGDESVFERLELGHGRVALRDGFGRYLAVRPDAGLSYAVYPVPELTPAAAFEEILWPSSEVSLRSCHLTYLSAESSGRVTVNRTEASTRERFVQLTVPVPSLLQGHGAPTAPTTRG